MTNRIQHGCPKVGLAALMPFHESILELGRNFPFVNIGFGPALQTTQLPNQQVSGLVKRPG
jgi:hypothetical protein